MNTVTQTPLLSSEGKIVRLTPNYLRNNKFQQVSEFLILDSKYRYRDVSYSLVREATGRIVLHDSGHPINGEWYVLRPLSDIEYLAKLSNKSSFGVKKIKGRVVDLDILLTPSIRAVPLLNLYDDLVSEQKKIESEFAALESLRECIASEAISTTELLLHTNVPPVNSPDSVELVVSGGELVKLESFLNDDQEDLESYLQMYDPDSFLESVDFS